MDKSGLASQQAYEEKKCKVQEVVTIFIFYLSRCHEDAVLHLHSPCWSVVRPIQFTLLTQLSQDLRRFHRISPHVVAVAEGKEQK